MKYYVYALNANDRCITTALSFPDEKTAEDIYRAASFEIDENNTGVFRFGYTSNSQVTNDWDVRFNDAKAELEIGFMSLPRDGYSSGVEEFRIFGIDEFEKAEIRTEKCLSDSRYLNRLDIQFMRSVKLVMTGDLPLPITLKAGNTVNSASTRSQKNRKQRPRKYEVHVEEYLIDLKEGVLDGTIPSTRVANLSSKEIAECLAKKDEFKDRKMTCPSENGRNIPHGFRYSVTKDEVF